MSEEIQKYMKILNIKCSRCLDTQILWKGRDNVFFARMDGRGDYDIMNCDKCSGGGWNRCSHTKDVYVKGIHAFHVADGEWHALETLRPIVKPHLERIAQEEKDKQTCILEQERERQRIKEEADRIRKENEDRIRKEEADRIRKEKEEADRIRKEKEEADRIRKENEDRIKKEKKEADRIQKEKEDRIQKEKDDVIRIQKEKDDDANPIALWSYYKKDDIKKHIKHSDIQIEVGKIAERIYEAVKLSSGDITELTSLIKELKMDLKSSMESSTSHKTELKQVNNSEGRFKITYVKLYISNEIETTSCDCLEWCGFNTKESHFSLEYTIYNPRNIAAKIKCDEDMSIHVIM